MQAALKEQSGRELSYANVGSSWAESPSGDYVNRYEVHLGQGEAVFAAACRSLREWQHFSLGWVQLRPVSAVPLEVGIVLASLANIGPTWWFNVCRIVCVVDERAPVRRFGFAFGTLPDHAESGEECFVVEMTAEGQVTFRIRSISRPHHWLARLFAPFVRFIQRRFVREACERMRDVVGKHVSVSQTPSHTSNL